MEPIRRPSGLARELARALAGAALLCALAGAGPLPGTGLAAGAQSGGGESAALARAKAAHAAGMEALGVALGGVVEAKQRELFPAAPTNKFDLVAADAAARRLEREARLLASEGAWPACAATDIQSLATLRALKAKLDEAYRAAFDQAAARRDSAARDLYAKELGTFGAHTELAQWRSLIDAAQLDGGAARWTRTSKGLASPSYPDATSARAPLRVPLATVPRRPQYKLRIVIESLTAGGGVRIGYPDSRGNRLECAVSQASVDAALRNKVSGQAGAALVVTVLEQAARVELEGRTLALAATGDAPAAAPAAALLEVLPEGTSQLVIGSLAWKPLRDEKPDLATSSGPPDEECPQAEAWTAPALDELVQAKAAYESGLRTLVQDLAGELRKSTARSASEQLDAAVERMKKLEEEAKLLETAGAWPASRRSDIEWTTRARLLRERVATAYGKAGIEANRAKEACVRGRLANELAAFQRCTDYAEWRSYFLDAVVVEKGRGSDSSRLLCPLRFEGVVPEQYKLEFVVAREGDGAGFLVRAWAPSTGAIEHHVSKAELDLALARGKQGARFLLLAQPGHARIEAEGMPLWHWSDDVGASAEPADSSRGTWLELAPDADTRLVARAFQWKPLVAIATAEEPAAAKPGEKAAPGEAPKDAGKDAGRDAGKDPGKDPGKGAAKSLPNPGHTPAASHAALQGLAWLVAHQSPEGSWEGAGFAKHCGRLQADSRCDGAGQSSHDVGLTGLAMLAMLHASSAPLEGPYADPLARAARWLREQQAPSGIYGEKSGHSFIYNHAIATLAICEALPHDPALKPSATKAVEFLLASRNPSAGWRYNSPPTGESDSSVTGWCMLALHAARQAGVGVDPAAFEGAVQWLASATDPETGRTGYQSPGSPSARGAGLNDRYPADSGEALTALALRCRSVLDKKFLRGPLAAQQIELLLARQPEWDTTGLANDVYYWYHGSNALALAGGKPWDRWQRAVEKALGTSQAVTGDAKGSWPPKDAWAEHYGGRVYMTALAVLCLEDCKRSR